MDGQRKKTVADRHVVPCKRVCWQRSSCNTHVVEEDVARGPLEQGHLCIGGVPPVDGLGVQRFGQQHRGDVGPDALVQDVALGCQLRVVVYHQGQVTRGHVRVVHDLQRATNRPNMRAPSSTHRVGLAVASAGGRDLTSLCAKVFVAIYGSGSRQQQERVCTINVRSVRRTR